MASKSSVAYKQYKIILGLMYFNIIAPFVICMMFIKPLLQGLVVPEYLSVETWRSLRTGFIVLTICVRLLTFREEL